MKKILLMLAVVSFIHTTLSAQVVINEFLFNIPSTGEIEEYVELHNTSASPVNLLGYSMRDGSSAALDITFGNVSIPANGYFVVAFDSLVFLQQYGFSPDYAWAAGLNNGGDDIILYDNTGTLIDSVSYTTAAPWPAEGSQGYAMQLCDASTDNSDGANWGYSNDSVAVNSQDATVTLYGTPGAANICFTPPAATYPVYSIDQINGVDANGVADSLNVTCEIRAVAYCQNNRLSQTGYDFPFANSDNSAGVRVFSFNDISGYVFNEGDSLHMTGTVSQFRGLLQFEPDSIALISSGNVIPSPAVTTTLDETTENKFIIFQNVYLADTTQWTTGAGFGFNVNITNGTDTFDVRIDSDINLFNLPVPVGNFNMTGWGGQRDFNSPYDSDYQLIPCDASLVLSSIELDDKSIDSKIYPNPARDILNVVTSNTADQVIITNTLGQKMMEIININTNSLQINTSTLSKGVYYISIIADNLIQTKTFTISK